MMQAVVSLAMVAAGTAAFCTDLTLIGFFFFLGGFSVVEGVSE